ncbi:hypothetical protein KIH41_02530 [Litoribacter ruber]|uniref:Uncharacterized protein n=1 Tax=Litoribacter ruber TaxID=702568 RepID=A0AAP2G6K5_9BACT|nr:MULTISPECIES: hypothetical protein [Litoribacter]MBS9525788.1 hypothetical protein [Litoribacter alkaliphilus]MBT0810156.1 hypothetical protein [Litoribacter ruber]
MSKKDLKYISSRLVQRKSAKAFKEGAKKAMEINGYVVIAHDGWVVKKYQDGTIVKLKQISHGSEHLKVVLD